MPTASGPELTIGGEDTQTACDRTTAVHLRGADYEDIIAVGSLYLSYLIRTNVNIYSLRILFSEP